MKYKIEVDNAYPAFDHAYRHVLDTYRDTVPNKVRKHFEEEHGVRVICDESWGEWTDLIFPNEEAYTFFMLKWS